MMTVTRPTAAFATALLLAVTLISASTPGNSVVDAHNNNDEQFHSAIFDFGTSNQTLGEAFRDCVCWNTSSQNWCHHAQDGPHDGLWRRSCQRVVYYNYWWAVFAVLWMVWLGIAPVTMCFFRLLCNCCGGRKPSYGCCCPYDNKLVSSDPKFVRPYSRCATYTAKILAVLGFAAVVTLSVHGFIATENVSTAIANTIGGVKTAADDVGTYFTPSSIQEFEGLATTISQGSYGSSWFHMNAVKLSSLSQTYLNRKDDLFNAMHDIQEYKGKYLVGPFNLLIGIPLVLVTIVTLLAMCNKGGWFTSISAGLLSFMTIAVVTLATVLAVASIAGDTICNNVESVENFAVDAMSTVGCNIPDITESINATQIAFTDMLCQTLELSTLISATVPANESICSPQGMFTRKAPGFAGVPVVNQALLMSTMSSFGVVVLKDYPTVGIQKCAMTPDCVKQNPKTKALSNFYSNYSKIILGDTPAGDQAVPSLFRSNFNCSNLRFDLKTSIIPTLCPTSNNQYTNPALRASIATLGGFMFGLATVFTLLFWIWMNGSKRFAKGHSRSEMYAIHHEFGVMPDAPMLKHHSPIPEEAPHHQAPPAVQPAQHGNNNSAQPLLLQHDTPSYSTTTNVKVQPEPLP